MSEETPDIPKQEKKLKKRRARRRLKKEVSVDIIEPDLRPWDQQPGEEHKSYLRFLTYRDLGEGRSFKKAFSKTGRSSGGIFNELSKKWNWVERCNQFDIFVKQEKYKKRMVSQDQISEHADRLAFVALEKQLEAISSIQPEHFARMIKENNSIKDAIDLIKAIRGEKITAKLSGKVNMVGAMSPEVVKAYMTMIKEKP